MTTIRRRAPALVPFLAASLCFTVSAAFAQQPRYHDIWYFGNQAGLDFRSNPPTPLSGAMSTSEGSASICDPQTGDLLFYTEGETVWNRNHQVMRNGAGLFGFASSTQSAVIVPDPGDSLRYYLFTQEGTTFGPDGRRPRGLGVHYSTIDMRGDNGLGEVVEKNRPLLNIRSEKLVGLRHANGSDFWVVTVEGEDRTNRFHAWLVTDDSVHTRPITSALYGAEFSSVGYLKASPDGTLLFSIYGPSTPRSGGLYCFNPSTGVVEDFLAELPTAYGASFSPNSRFLYTVGRYGLMQVDLSRDTCLAVDQIYVSPDSSANPIPIYGYHGMQLGPDGKLYVIGTDFFGVVESPDVKGKGCNFHRSSLAVNYSYGLPNCIDGFFSTTGSGNRGEGCRFFFLDAGEDRTICPGDSVQLHASVSGRYSWSPDDDLSCTNCPDPVATPRKTTTYRLTTTDEGCTIVDSITITVTQTEAKIEASDTSICRGSQVLLRGNGGTEYLWSSDRTPECSDCREVTVAPEETTTYILRATLNGSCPSYDTVTIFVGTPPVIETGPDTTLCRGESIRLHVTAPEDVIYQWSSPAGTDDLSCTDCPDPVASPSESVTYHVNVLTPDSCLVTDSVRVTVTGTDARITVSDTLICRGEEVTLSASGGEDYLWESAERPDCPDCSVITVRPTQTATYYLRATIRNRCETTDSVTITVVEPPDAEAGQDTAICLGDSIYLHGNGEGDYRWFPARDISCFDCPSPLVYPESTTTYLLRVTNRWGCISWDSVTVTVESQSDLSTRGDTAFCPGGKAGLSVEGAESYRWFPSETLNCDNCPNPVATPDTSTTYYVIGTNSSGGCPSFDSVTVIVHPLPTADAGTDTAICAGQTLRLPASGGTRYQWEDDQGLSCTDCPDPLAAPEQTTTYFVTVYSEHGCADRDSVRVTVYDLPVASAGNDQALCRGDTVRLRGEGGIRWQWEPEEGLSCSNCSDPLAFPDETTTYILRSWNAEDCETADSVTVTVQKEPKLLHARIGRAYRAYSGEPIVISIELREGITVSDITDLAFELGYDPDIMVPDPASIERLLDGTMLEGWNVEVTGHTGGELAVRVHAPPGVTLSGSGDLLRFESRLYLSNVSGTELPFSVRPASRCFTFLSDPGYAELDSICGLNFRLIEANVEKFVPPTPYPNPATERVTVEFGLGLDGPVRLEVFDMEGERIGLLLDEWLGPGRYGVEWDVRSIPSGTYWYRLTCGDWSGTGQISVAQ